MAKIDQEEMRAKMAAMGINVSGKIKVGGQVIEGGQTNIIHLTPEESAKVQAQVAKATAEAGQFTTKTPPQEFYSEDFVVGTINRNGIKYKLDRATIDDVGHFRYVRIDD